MVHPEASTSERKVTSRYWAGGTSPTTLRGKSVPALGNKRVAPECDDSTDLEAELLRRKHAKTFDFKPAHDEVEVKDEPASTQSPSDQHLHSSEQSQSKVPQSVTNFSVSIEPLPPTVTAPVRPPSSNVQIQPHPPSPSIKPSSATCSAKSSSLVTTIKPARGDSDSEASIQCPKPLTRPRTCRAEDAVVATLTHIHDDQVTDATINLVLRWGREAPNPAGDIDDLGITYLEGILSRIDAHGVEPQRRVVVVDLLVSKLIRHLEALRSRIGTLSAPQLPLSPPSSVDRPVHLDGDAHENDHRINTLAPRSTAARAIDGHIAPNGLRHRLEQQMTGAEDIDTDQDIQTAPAKFPASASTVATSKKLFQDKL
jgi:hypothetical protein